LCPAAPRCRFRNPWTWATDALVLVSGTSEAPTTLVVTGSLNTTQPITLPANTVLRVVGGAVNAGNIQMSEGSVLEVVGGDITFGAAGEQTTLSGTFVFFDSFGSVNINGDTTVASTGNWILISDVHVANGVTITVTGGLIWDGSYIDSPGRFDVVVVDGGSFGCGPQHDYQWRHYRASRSHSENV
jgi:hypothetical protein